MNLDIILRFTALLIFFFWWIFWRQTERVAERDMPKTYKSKSFLKYLSLTLIESIIAVQLLGVSLFPMYIAQKNILIQVVGLLCVIGGAIIAISARITLGANWSHAFEYQVKKKQVLITNGIYAYVRHPIYLGLLIAFIGGELLAQSYLVFALLLFFLAAYRQMKKEEKLLIAHYGEAYRKYMKSSKMFLPFLW